jgi:hypothetical protein
LPFAGKLQKGGTIIPSFARQSRNNKAKTLPFNPKSRSITDMEQAEIVKCWLKQFVELRAAIVKMVV